MSVVEKGTALNYLDLLFRMRQCLTGNKLLPVGDISYPVGADSVLEEVRLIPTVAIENVTLTVADTGAGSANHPCSIANSEFTTQDMTSWTVGAAGAAVKQVPELGINWVVYGLASDATDFSQIVAIPGTANTGIDAGKGLLELSWLQASANGLDVARIEVLFRDAVSAPIGSASVTKDIAGFPDSLLTKTHNIKIPALAREFVLSIYLKTYDSANVDTDSYVTSFVANVVTDPLEFTVSGSVSGAMETAFANEDYDANQMTYHMNPGTYSFSLSETITFSTAPSTLTTQATDESWAVNNGDGEWNGRLYLEGPGLAGTDAIHIIVENDVNSTEDYYNLLFKGAIDYNSVEHLAPDNQPGISGGVSMQFWDDSIPYWIIADGRRFILLAKISTVYQGGYFGFYLPYATPGQLPYPILVGGTYSTTGLRWSSESINHRGVFDPSTNNVRLRKLNGEWLSIRNKYISGASEVTETKSNIWPWNNNQSVRENIDGSYSLEEAVIYSDDDGGNVLGNLDGLFWISGFANASENILSIGGNDYIVIQNVFRTGFSDYMAVRLT